MKSFTLKFALLSALLLAVVPAQAVDLNIPMLPGADEFGLQIETVQIYRSPGVEFIEFGIYDTGASAITFPAVDLGLFPVDPIPIKCAGCAGAEAIGGAVIGDVSQPGTIVAAGSSAVTFDSSFNITVDETNAVTVNDIQAFVGTPSGSPNLPTLTGTPIHKNNTAARIDLVGTVIDLGVLLPGLGLDGIEFSFPDIQFVPTGDTLSSSAGTTGPITIPLDYFGANNLGSEGQDISFAENPVQPNVTVKNGVSTITDKTFLLDTGAQLSVISTEIAVDGFGLDLLSPDLTLDVQGAGGAVTSIPGFYIDALELPRDDDGDGDISNDDLLRFTDVPVFVLDIVPGIDGILGMNLFNPASEMLYDPFDSAGSYEASLQLNFLNDRLDSNLEIFEGLDDGIGKDLAALFLDGNPVVTASIGIPGITSPSGSNDSVAIPEPGSLFLLLVGMMGLMVRSKRRRS